MKFPGRSNIVGLIGALLLAGCSTRILSPGGRDEVILVPGIGGDGAVYGNALRSLRDHGSLERLSVSDWGSSYAIFFISISSSAWHHHVERQLAREIERWRQQYPLSRIALIAHSAGAGVAAGAVAQLPDGVDVGPVIFLAPALSPKFDLGPMLRHTSQLHVFYSRADFFWQGIGPTIFGNYDGAHRSGAGRYGFALASLNAAEKSRVVQHPYDPAWKALKSFGGHYDWLSPRFVAAVLKPIIDADRAR